MEVSWVMGVPAVVIHFLLGLSMKQIIQLLGYFHFRKPQDIGHGRVNDDCSLKPFWTCGSRFWHAISYHYSKPSWFILANFRLMIVSTRSQKKTTYCMKTGNSAFQSPTRYWTLCRASIGAPVSIVFLMEIVKLTPPPPPMLNHWPFPLVSSSSSLGLPWWVFHNMVSVCLLANGDEDWKHLSICYH